MRWYVPATGYIPGIPEGTPFVSEHMPGYVFLLIFL